MKLRRFFVLILIILTAISFKFPDTFQLLGTKLKAIPSGLPFNAMEADAEAENTDEYRAIILDAIREVKDSIKIRIVKYDEKAYDVNTALKKVLDENVGLSFVTGCNASLTQILGRDSAVVELKLKYLYPREQVVAMRAETENKADEIIKNIIEPGMSDYEKVLAVHDYIITSSRYDRLNADSNTVPQEEHEAYGVLVKGIGVCDSYAKAVKLLLDKAEVWCMLVEGSKAEADGQRLSDVDHAWNIVKLDREYYHVDTTWDDVSEDKDSTDLVYYHLNLNDEEMQKTHIWDRSKYPICAGTKYNYFRYNKLIANNQAETLKMLVKAISDRDRKMVVKISDYKSSTYNIEKLIKKAAEKSNLKQGIGAKWIVNEVQGIVELEFTY